jgi:hypothetical protein
MRSSVFKPDRFVRPNDLAAVVENRAMPELKKLCNWGRNSSQM